jgi:hypothetical protein
MKKKLERIWTDKTPDHLALMSRNIGDGWG